MIQCVRCEGMDARCELCNGDGYIPVNECPMKYVGQQMIDAANLVGFCKSGVFPADGGLLNQSAWFLQFIQRLRAETNQIESEQIKRAKNG